MTIHDDTFTLVFEPCGRINSVGARRAPRGMAVRPGGESRNSGQAGRRRSTADQAQLSTNEADWPTPEDHLGASLRASAVLFGVPPVGDGNMTRMGRGYREPILGVRTGNLGCGADQHLPSGVRSASCP